MSDLYLANINHEVRTLISAIFACANLLEESVRDRPDALDLVKVLRQNGEHLLSLVDNALDLSKLESGKMQLRPARCDIGQLVDEIRTLMQPQAQQKQLRLDARCRGRVPRWIVTDPLRLKQILVNLLSNAIKFTHEGAISLTVHRLDLPGVPSQLCFEVADTGVGIRENQLDHIFEPFVQAEPSHAGHPIGTGLGLTISRKLAERMGGRLTVHSTPGEGSTFQLAVTPSMCSGEDCIDTIPHLLTQEQTHTPQTPGRHPLPTKLHGVQVMLAVARSDLRLMLSVLLKSAGARLTIVDPPETLASLVDRAATSDPPVHVLVLAPNRRQCAHPATFATLETAGSTCGVVVIRPPASAPDLSRRLSLAGIHWLTEPIDTLKVIHVISRAAATTINRSAG